MTIGSGKANDSAPNLSRQEHEGAADAKRVTIVGHDGANYYLAGVNSSGQLLVSGVGGSSLATVTVLQGTDPWVVTGTVGLLGSFTGGFETVTCLQGTSPWIVDGTVTVIGGGSETVTCIQGTDPWIVNGTVGVIQGAAPWVVDGTVTVIGGGSETVTCIQGTDPWTVDGTVGVTGNVNVTQGTSPWVTSGTVSSICVGLVADGTTTSGNPVQIAGEAYDYEPVAADDGVVLGPSAVTEGDVARPATNLNKELVTAVKCFYVTPTNIITDYDTTSSESQTSAHIECWWARRAAVGVSISKTGTPTGNITITIREYLDPDIGGSSVPRKRRDGPLHSWTYSAAAVPIATTLEFDICCFAFDVLVNATGLTASTNEYHIDDAHVWLRT